MSKLLKQRYLSISQLGKGGMGIVYKAQDTLLGNRLVAIKEMSQNGLDPQQIISASKAFQQEAYILAGLHHPNLPGIYDYFEEGRRWYLVMTFIEGETLEDYVVAKGGKLEVTEVLDIGIQLCSVLDYLHNRNPPIIFRDLKPLNIMRVLDGHLYLIDFGIARHFKLGQNGDTRIGYTPGYAAPEQYGLSQTTPRADIYSLGATLHQLLSGNNPSRSPFLFSPLRLQDRQNISKLETLILPMVDIDESRRPPSMSVVKQRLQEITADNTLVHKNPSQFDVPNSPTPLTQLMSTIEVKPLNTQTLDSKGYNTPNSAKTSPVISKSSSILSSEVPILKKASRRIVLTSLTGLVVAGALGGTWWAIASHSINQVGGHPTDTSGSSASPTSNNASPTNNTASVPVFAAGQTWEGTANQFDYGKYPMIFNVKAIHGSSFSAFLNWPQFGNTITNVIGTIVSDFGDFTEQRKWQFVDGFKSGAMGRWLKFTEISFAQGSSVLLNDWYYAVVRDDNTLHGVWFRTGENSPHGDYVIVMKP